MLQADQLRSLEEAAYRSWPARELERFDNWDLRHADGFSRRGNSVYPRGPSEIDWASKLGYCDGWFRRRNLGLVLRLTPETEPGLDEALDSAGFTAEGRTNVMVASLDPNSSSAEPMSRSELWAEAAARLWQIEGDRKLAWLGILDRIDLPSDYRVWADDEGPHAVALGVVDGCWLGIFELIVAKSMRRQGIGERLLMELFAWGSGQGASSAYLQVVEENEAAIALYRSTGFERAYQYWYRRAPSL